jgi:hypothetical protein
LERKKPTPEETANVRAHPVGSNGATRGATEDRSRDRRQAISRRGRPKKRTQDDCGSCQKLAAARRRLTRRAVPARRKARHREGPRVEKGSSKGPKCNSGIRNQDLEERLCLGNKGNVNDTFKQAFMLQIMK